MKFLTSIFFILGVALEAGAQKPEFGKPEALDKNVNSEDEELAPILSPDGMTLYFSRAFHGQNTGGKYAGTDIWISRKDANGNWTPAVNAGKPWNNKRSNAVIGISKDGQTMYLLNAYKNASGIAFSRSLGGHWTKPEIIPIPGLRTSEFLGAYVSPDYEVIILSMNRDDGRGEEDLYVSIKSSSGKWSSAINLGPSINTAGFETSPFLTPDKKRLYFASNGHDGFGDADIFYSDRLYDSWETWTAPKNLGEGINTSGFEGYFSMANDSVALFVNHQSESGANICKLRIGLPANNDKREEILKAVEESKLLLSELQKGGNSTDRPLPATVVFDKQGRLDAESTVVLNRFIRYLKANPATNLSVIWRSSSKAADQMRMTEISKKVEEANLSDERIRFVLSSDPLEPGENKALLSIRN